MAFTLVSSLMEGSIGFGGVNDITDFGTFSSVSEAASYTLESGASMIATQCLHELHEIFECAVVETSEAELSAIAEGYQSLEESAQYSSVFESAEVSAGQKIILFLRKLGDRVMAFFINIATKLSTFVHNYDKWFDKHKKAMNEAGKTKLDVKNWNVDKIASVSSKMDGLAGKINTTANELAELIKKTLEDQDASEQKKEYLQKKFDNKLQEILDDYAKDVTGATSASAEFFSSLNANIWKTFCPSEKSEDKEVDIGHVHLGMSNVKKSADGIKSSQKKFNTAYKSAVKSFDTLIKDAEKKQRKGYSQLCHKAVSILSKCQTIVNAYANCGYRAVIGMANESIRIGNKLISSKK